MEFLSALYAKDKDGRLQLLGTVHDGAVASQIALRAIEELPKPGSDRHLDRLRAEYRSLLNIAALGGGGVRS